jgi:flagellar FliL protein
MKRLNSPLMAMMIALLGVAAGAGSVAVWWRWNGGTSAPTAAPVIAYKYTTLDKVIVMLRPRSAEDPAHYLALDLVLKSPPESDATTRAHLPLVRSLTVRALANLSYDDAKTMTIDQYAVLVNRAYVDGYRAERREKPFAEAMIGKLLVE